MDNRPMCLSHDDYHVGNFILSHDNKLFVIDFNRLRFVEPYKAFSGIVFSAKTSPHFATGQIRGYFGDESCNDSMNPPMEFWQLLSLYMAAIAINGLPWSIPYGQEEIEFGRCQIEDILHWYDGFKTVVPTWYLKDFYIQYIDGVPLKLKTPFDFSFVSKYGKVFKVFDDQDSGNLCFGMKKDGNRYFVKFAGAPTACYNGSIADVIARLKPIAHVYRNLEHPNLIRFISAEEIGGGYAVVFEWTDAVGIGRMYPLAHKRFVALPLETRMKVFDDILAFHDYVMQRGYVAIDFYDGTIMYDFETGKTVICDVDFYQKSPYYGDMGIWGSSKFVSPEECVVGERMDEITTVYTMGATAFALLSEFDRSREAWKLSDKSYAVVKKATSDNRTERQQSVRQFIEEWEAAK
jgi:serine/threonine-protein kinase